ncbi:farnesyl-diphosphate synthase [Mycena vulgaris]|nr:farnesyl-diphosphate synthase [Mycena vulgaris]
MDKAAKHAKFEGAWARSRGELIEHITGEGMPAEAIEWYGKNLDYNVPGGKLNRGMSIIDTAEILKGAPLDDDEYYKAAVLGWGVELVSLNCPADILWYRAPGIGMIVINDSFMLEGAIYYLLKKHFRGTPYYVDLLELFHGTTCQTEMGQLIDLITAPEDHVDLNRFPLDKCHCLIIIYKTAYYSFYLPVALAMLMSGYFQIQDDFLDFSAPPEQLGKIGTDIVDDKCSWCVNTALAVVTPAQRAVLDAKYGCKDAAAEARVKEVFEAVDIRERYAKYEGEVYGRLVELIAAIPEDAERGTLKREIFTSFLEKIRKRTK